jgi:hypothetical protein
VRQKAHAPNREPDTGPQRPILECLNHRYEKVPVLVPKESVSTPIF